jgi:hypothetical protein
MDILPRKVIPLKKALGKQGHIVTLPTSKEDRYGMPSVLNV